MFNILQFILFVISQWYTFYFWLPTICLNSYLKLNKKFIENICNISKVQCSSTERQYTYNTYIFCYSFIELPNTYEKLSKNNCYFQFFQSYQ